MKGLNICVDIDGTVTTPYYWVRFAEKYFEKEIKIKDITEYEIHRVLNISRDEYLKFYDIYKEEIHWNAIARHRAKRILTELAMKHSIYYVTAREKELSDITKKWLLRRKLPITDLFVLGSHYKVDKAKELGCDIFIEDRYENAIELAKENFKVLLIDCNYNRKDLPEEITRVKSWDDIYEEINDYYEIIEKLEVA